MKQKLGASAAAVLFPKQRLRAGLEAFVFFSALLSSD